MPVAEKQAGTQTTHAEPGLDQGTYEVLRNRLRTQGKELQARLNRLHAERKKVFGSIDLALVGTERIATAHNCVPRDVVVVGERLIFGYNVQFGLKVETALADVFAVYAYQDRKFSQQSLELIDAPEFQSDFKDLYRYYKHCQFVKFARRRLIRSFAQPLELPRARLSSALSCSKRIMIRRRPDRGSCVEIAWVSAFRWSASKPEDQDSVSDLDDGCEFRGRADHLRSQCRFLAHSRRSLGCA